MFEGKIAVELLITLAEDAKESGSTLMRTVLHLCKYVTALEDRIQILEYEINHPEDEQNVST